MVVTCLQRSAKVPEVATYTFDYSSHSLDWVNNEAIGPRLAQAIDCLAIQAHHKVIVIAHSLGALATEFAQGQTESNGGQIANDLALVITIGAPFEGSQLLALLNNEVNALPPVVHAALDVMLTACGFLAAAAPLNDDCWLAGIPRSSAGLALTPGSPELAVTPYGQPPRGDSLPGWAPQVPVHTIAADIELSYSIGIVSLSSSIGDLPVSVTSATADASAGNMPLIATCTVRVTSPASLADALLCYHGDEISNPTIVTDAVNQVRFIAAANREPTEGSAPPSSTSFHLPGIVGALIPLAFLLFILWVMLRRPRRSERNQPSR